jgi:hypothetical protein
MDAAMITAIAELAKLGLMAYASWMKQAGLTNEQIETVFADTKKAMLARNPADIPSS